MLAVYVAVSGGVYLVAWLIRATLRKLKFEAYDRHLGMILGGAEGAMLGVVATVFVVSLAPATRQPILTACSALADMCRSPARRLSMAVRQAGLKP